MHRSYSKTLEEYPLLENKHLREEISSLLTTGKFKIVILDDDPTGIQTVHDCLLITKWTEENLTFALNDSVPFFYVLTNSRSLNAEETKKINREIVDLVTNINKSLNYKLIFISRSDSTLRGHFPLEPDTISSTLKQCGLSLNIPVFFIPAFLEAGRYTIDNVHYLQYNDDLIPVAETEFAQDNAFGYKNSGLVEYIIEKSAHKTNGDHIGSLSIEELRNNSLNAIIEKINNFKSLDYVIVNAIDYDELQKFAVSILTYLLNDNSCLVLRTSSSFPKALSGIVDQSLLTKDEIITKNGTGIFFVGSHVKKTTAQLENLLSNKKVGGVELNINDILTNPGKIREQTKNVIKELVTKEITPVIFTSRDEMRFEDITERLLAGKKISAFLVSIVKELPFVPAYIVAKGGITSNDILSDGLNVERARVLGQILTGVPAIITDRDNQFPRLPYIIFPGNVGDENSLLTVFEKLN
jgi:uncharacterized protein YgbK (DUF1537 family)